MSMLLAKRNAAIAADRRAGMTLAAIGKVHGISRERVRCICKRAAAPTDPDDIKSSSLSTRCRNVLNYAGCRTQTEALRWLSGKTTADLMTIYNCGRKSVKELLEWEHAQPARTLPIGPGASPGEAYFNRPRLP